MGLKPLITNLIGTFESFIAAAKNITTIKYVEKLSMRNNEIMKTNVIMIFTLGSRS